MIIELWHRTIIMINKGWIIKVQSTTHSLFRKTSYINSSYTIMWIHWCKTTLDRITLCFCQIHTNTKTLIWILIWWTWAQLTIRTIWLKVCFFQIRLLSIQRGFLLIRWSAKYQCSKREQWHQSIRHSNLLNWKMTWWILQMIEKHRIIKLKLGIN